MPHQKVENISPGAATEAMEKLLDGADRKRRCLFGVERAKPRVVLSRLF